MMGTGLVYYKIHTGCLKIIWNSVEDGWVGSTDHLVEGLLFDIFFLISTLNINQHMEVIKKINVNILSPNSKILNNIYSCVQ